MRAMNNMDMLLYRGRNVFVVVVVVVVVVLLLLHAPGLSLTVYAM